MGKIILRLDKVMADRKISLNDMSADRYTNENPVVAATGYSGCKIIIFRL